MEIGTEVFSNIRAYPGKVNRHTNEIYIRVLATFERFGAEVFEAREIKIIVTRGSTPFRFLGVEHSVSLPR